MPLFCRTDKVLTDRSPAGELQICQALHLPLEQVLIVGNSQKDADMMSLVPHSCAVLNADPLLKEQARYILNPDRLPGFFQLQKLLY